MAWTEQLLLGGACLLICAAVVSLVLSPLTSGALLLAAAAIAALVHERINTRHAIDLLTERLNAVGSLSKLEILSAGHTELLDQAVNRAIQRTREARTAAGAPMQRVSTASETADQSLMVAVLSVALRADSATAYSATHGETLASIAADALASGRHAQPVINLQGDGTLLLTFGAHQPQPAALSMREALDVASALASRYSDLRFGLSCGSARLCTVPGATSTFIGMPLEDAVRLSRMASAWHEYSLLCTEPVALLARAFPGQRTTLQLTHAAMPPLPVYALALKPAEMAISA